MSTDHRGAGILLIANDTGRILLGKRSEGKGQGTWSILGGRSEEGETPEETAVREFREESGLSVKLLGMDKIQKDDRYHTYVAFTPEEKNPTGGDGEHSDFKWVEADELSEYNLFSEFEKGLNDINLKHLVKRAKKNRRLDEEIRRRFMEKVNPDLERVRKSADANKITYTFPESGFEKLQDNFLDIDLDERQIDVPKIVLEQIQNMTELYDNLPSNEKVVEWYQELNNLSEDVSNSKAQKYLFGIFTAIGSTKSPFLSNFYESAVAYAAIKHDLEGPGRELLLKFLDDTRPSKYALHNYDKIVNWIRELKDDKGGDGYKDMVRGSMKKKELKRAYDRFSSIQEEISSNRVDGYNNLATYYCINSGINLPFENSVLSSLTKYILSEGDNVDRQSVIGEIERIFDSSVSGRGYLLDALKTTGFAINVIDPGFAEQRMKEMLDIVDGLMVDSLWPSVDGNYSYENLMRQSLKLADGLDLLVQEVVAIMWMKSVTQEELKEIGDLSESTERILKYLEVINDTIADQSSEITDRLRQTVTKFQDLRDFKLLHERPD